MKILITGGAGFIGTNFILYMMKKYSDYQIVNFDSLTYAGNLNNLKEVESNPNYNFIKGDICNEAEVKSAMTDCDWVVHFAAESHVDRSIMDPDTFVKTNILGTNTLLRIAKELEIKRFHHISTDEVYGDLEGTDNLFTEETPYAPSSPYSATKASSDHLVRAWQRTFKFPTLITNCSNNYGPYQFPEKLIPLIILNALEGKNLPIYGNGKQIRDWLYVDDHARALLHVALTGKIGETYNIGGHNEMQNIEVVREVCSILDRLLPSSHDNISKYEELITYVDDRAGHDIRYAVDATKISNELGWTPDETFASGIYKTVHWYLNNNIWYNKVKNGSYQIKKNRYD